MGKPTGFLEFARADRKYEPVDARIKHWHEFVVPLPDPDVKDQAARCMDCGIPYCHTGCPVNNQIPDWNDLVYKGDWKTAAAEPAFDQQLPRGDGPRLPGAVRSVVHAQHRRHAGHHQDDRVRDRRPRACRGLGGAAAARGKDRQEESRSSARDRQGSPPRSSSRAPAMTCTSTRRTRGPADCSSTAFPTSRWRRASSRRA